MVSNTTIKSIKKDLKKLKEDYMFLNAWIKGINPETCGVGEKKHYNIQVKELYALHLYISAKEELLKTYEQENEGYQKWQERCKQNTILDIGAEIQKSSKYNINSKKGYLLTNKVKDALLDVLNEIQDTDRDKSIKGLTSDMVCAKYLKESIVKLVDQENENILVPEDLIEDILVFLNIKKGKEK